jgi:uncharacterized protein YjbJ (UPF0337 family)
MDTDRIIGTAEETVGKAEAAFGNVTGDRETEASGRVRQAAGAAQDVYGQAKDTLGDTIADASESAEKVFASARDAVKPIKESLEREVTARPLIALLIAALIGYVLAQLTTN